MIHSRQMEKRPPTVEEVLRKKKVDADRAYVELRRTKMGVEGVWRAVFAEADTIVTNQSLTQPAMTLAKQLEFRVIQRIGLA